MDQFETDAQLFADIVNYLNEIHNNGEDIEGWDVNLEETHSEILRDAFTEDWDEKIKEHNQYHLFNLAEIIENFEIDDNKMEKLTFRENLLVASFLEDANSPVPVPVGGLCLDIQKALGREPFVRKVPQVSSKAADESSKAADVSSKTADVSSKAVDVSSKAEDTSRTSPTQSLVFSKEETEVLLKEMTGTENKFLVHLSAQLDVEENNAGSTITSWVDKNLHTIEERRVEYINDPDAPKDVNQKQLYCGLQKGCYYVQHTSRKDSLKEDKYYSLQKMRDYIGEGANFILMRYLAITRYFGEFELATLYINGDPCRNIYKCTGPEGGLFNEKRLDICRIYRTVIEECGLEHKSATVLTLEGQIIKHEWSNCPYVLHLNPLADVSNKKPAGNEHLLLEKIWEKDMQLFSRYLDRKTACKHRLTSYLLDNPELKELLADYVQAILLIKPEDVVDYTVNHFLHFVPQYLPRDDYFESEQGEETIEKWDAYFSI